MELDVVKRHRDAKKDIKLLQLLLAKEESLLNDAEISLEIADMVLDEAW